MRRFIVGSSSARLARRAALTAAIGRRPFCAPGATGFEPPPKPRRRATKQKGGPGLASAIGACAVGGVGAYAVSSEVQEYVDNAAYEAGEAFEDFNDWTREIFERIGDRLVAKPDEPWLLDLATMKYPDGIPTLVMDMDKVLGKLEHDSVKGWQLMKRPFADQFVKEISRYYEIVIFSDDTFPVAENIVVKWALPVTGVLHREFCYRKRHHYVKDLSKLGRKLERVLIIDHDPAAFQLQPENGIAIRPFDGDTGDCELADLLEFLKAAATTPNDIRQFVNKFGGGDVDVGRRYLLHKQEQDVLVEKRRNVGRVFSASRGLPQGPPSRNFNNSFR